MRTNGLFIKEYTKICLHEIISMKKTHKRVKINPLSRFLCFVILLDLHRLKGIRMNSWNYSNARAQLSTLMDEAIAGFPVEITRKGRESAVIISKSSYEAYKKAEFDTAYLKKAVPNEQN